MAEKKSINGILVIDKPAGMTSFDVVRRVRNALKIKKVGHTGTLDPLATGVLPLCLGEATKIAGLLQADDKTYLGTALLGLETDTLDLEGQVVAEADPSAVTEERVLEVMTNFRGTQQQVPPAFSAIHKDGKRAYELARKGEMVDLPPRQVQIRKLELARWDPPRFDLLLECSKGTYVRSLVRDMGHALGCGAVLDGLRRIQCGAFDLESAVPLDEVRQRLLDGTLPLVSMDSALAHLPVVEVTQTQADGIRQGQPADVQPPEGEELIRILCEDRLVALGQSKAGKVWPKRVFKIED